MTGSQKKQPVCIYIYKLYKKRGCGFFMKPHPLMLFYFSALAIAIWKSF